MSKQPLDPAELQREHAIVHFFALLAGIEEIEVQMRLLVSGLAFFLRVDAVVLGFAHADRGTCSMHTWRAGSSSDFQTALSDQAAIEASVAHAMEALGYPVSRTLALVHLGKVMGYLALARRESAPLPAEAEFLLTSFQTLTALLLANYTERKHAEAAISRRNRTLAGINTIFQEALHCQTDEELGKTCLRVAEEITGSKFGFIAELAANGLLHELAISDPGWNACRMHDPKGHRRPPGNFKVHGLYGRVLRDGRSFFTNQPAEHPDSIGTPAGHPRLTAFLGVPLSDGTGTIGMIAVGNRVGGYRQEEVDSLEALAPAVVEALHRKRTEQALIRSEKLVSVGRLAATIAHEINNPLAAATNAVYLVAQDRSLSAEGRKLAVIAERELRMAAQIGRRTLGFYREPNARLPVPIAEILGDVAALYEPRIRDKDVLLKVRCPDATTTVIANPGEMRQLFSNLLANSLDAVGQAGAVHVRVAKASPAAGVPRVRITIADTGSGIEPHNLRRVFEPFFTTKRDVGTGLGLWIAEQILKKHGGTIRVRSRVGQGTVFCVELPAANEAAAFAATAGKNC